MSTKVAVVIPVYRELSELEKISLTQCRKVLGRYPLIFVAPEGKNFSFFERGDMVVHFSAKHFRGVKSYSNLLLSPFFYEPLRDFEYILIYQLDAFVFYDALEEFCSLGYDYIGAPWPYYAWLGSRKPKTPRVGNGGFSLRKVKACHKIAIDLAANADKKNILGYFEEDSLFATCGTIEKFDFHTAPVNAAELFAMNYFPARHVKKIGDLPFGCHDWTNYSADFYVELFRRFGYDLQPFRNQMKNDDYDYNLPGMLEIEAMRRLSRRIERGQSILRYLPANRFDAVRVIRSPEAVKILARLLTEENSLADRIFIYDSVEQINFRDVTGDLLIAVEDNPPLVIAEYDSTLIAAFEKHGLRYGEHFISFQREYLNRCEELFHGLGR